MMARSSILEGYWQIYGCFNSEFLQINLCFLARRMVLNSSILVASIPFFYFPFSLEKLYKNQIYTPKKKKNSFGDDAISKFVADFMSCDSNGDGMVSYRFCAFFLAFLAFFFVFFRCFYY
jgi:hypothetical protein